MVADTEPDFVTWHEVTRCLSEYAYALDSKDWRRLPMLFMPEVFVDLYSYNGETKAAVKLEDWAQRCEAAYAALDSTTHTLSNPLVEVAGKRARCRMYVQVLHRLGSREFVYGGYFDNQLYNASVGWRMEALTLNVFWRRGDASIMEQQTNTDPTLI